MKRLLAICILSVVMLEVSEAGSDAAKATPLRSEMDILVQSSLFSVGGVGITGRVSDAERALRSLLKAPDAIDRLREVLTRGTPSAKMYALAGLYFLDRDVYLSAVAPYRHSKEKLDWGSGCMIMKDTTLEMLLSQLEHGSFAGLQRETGREK